MRPLCRARACRFGNVTEAQLLWLAFRCASGTSSEMVGGLKAFGRSPFSVCWGSQQASTDVYPRYAALAVCTLAISPFANTGLDSLNPALHFGTLTSVQ